MILSASRRTDIPAFYHEWFLNRLRAGFVHVRHPMNPRRVSMIELSPDTVDCIVFWTKDPSRMLGRLDELGEYPHYFLFTVNGYGRRVEPGVPGLEDVLDTFRRLSDAIGPGRVVWRYDPVIVSDEFPPEYHERAFGRITRALAGKTRRCITSFVDCYKSTSRNMRAFPPHELSEEMEGDIALRLSRIAREHGIAITACAEKNDLSRFGIARGMCIDDALIERECGVRLDVGRDTHQRKECLCRESVDIGSYNTCPHGCLYCYANLDAEKARAGYASHDPASSMLVGEIENDDEIIERNVKSDKSGQAILFS